ncbi:MAG TPA: pyrrolo-quinoline quinone [Anaerolineaceae bacterium]|nr:pyrrolo-quinoline quinone [Anaerolineaceae bacterium]
MFLATLCRCPAGQERSLTMPRPKPLPIGLLSAVLIVFVLLFGSVSPAGQASQLLQITGTPVFLPLVANGSSSEWTQFAHDPMRTSFTEQVVPTPWRLKWIWNGPNTQGKVPATKFGLPRQSQPVTGGGRVYVAAGTRGVFALNNTSGAVVWNQTAIGSVNSTPAYDPRSDALLVVSANGRLYRLNAANGQILNQFNSGSTSSLPLPPALWEDTVYFSMGSKVFALDRVTLALRWEYNAGSAVETPPAYSPSTQTVVVVSADLYVHAINASNGSRRWRVKPPTPLQPGNPGNSDNEAEAKYGWPVIAEQHGLVFVRYRLHWQSIWDLDPNSIQNNAQLRQFFQNNRKDQPLFALRMSDGAEAFIPNVGNGGYGDGGYLPMGPLPAIARLADGKEVAYIPVRAGPCQAGYCDSRWDTHLGELLLDNQTVTGYQPGYVRFMDYTFVPTDEQPFVTVAGDMILAAHWEAGLAHQITDRSPARGATTTNLIRVSNLPHIATSQDEDACGTGLIASHYCASNLINTRYWPGGFYIYWKEGAVYDRYWSEYAGWVVSNNTIYFVSTDGAVIALEHGQPATSGISMNMTSIENNQPTPAPVLSEPIPYERAAEYAGWQASVEGQLVRVFNNGKAVYLSFIEPHQRQFVVRILKENWDAFPQPPESLYHAGQRVRVSGLIEWYQGGPVIYVSSPEQIFIIGE